MKKVALFVLATLLLATSFCLAQEARMDTYATSVYQGKSAFGNIAITGLNVPGNSAYIQMSSGNGDSDTPIVYYLWVDDTGDLRIASYSTISAFSSFPTGSWSTNGMTTGTVVGSQS